MEQQRTHSEETHIAQGHRHHFFAETEQRSAAESVEGASLSLERVDDVHGGDGLAAGMLGVGDGVADDVLEEDLEHAAGLLVDEPRDALHAAPPRQPPDRRLGDALDVVRSTFRWRLAPPFPRPFPPLPRPDMIGCLEELVRFGNGGVAVAVAVAAAAVGGRRG
uniref:Uncharacterized protein n=1 Tax=Triticum urartu TaxID=4572 RepID=A0A8R7UR92_TRIUA